MPLITGTPEGNILTPDANLFVDTPPVIYFQDKLTAAGATVGLLNNPDSDGFFWNLSGTTANPVFEVGCYEGLTIVDGRELNMIRCDTDGDVGAVQRRNSLTINFTLKQLFSFNKLAHMLNWSLPITSTAGATEKVGIGTIDNQKRYYAYLPTVYDPATGDFLSITAHNVQFTTAWTWTFVYANPSNVPITMTCFADTSRVDAQRFATVIRADPSDIT
jgi:hypothetical protein